VCLDRNVVLQIRKIYIYIYIYIYIHIYTYYIILTEISKAYKQAILLHILTLYKRYILLSVSTQKFTPFDCK